MKCGPNEQPDTCNAHCESKCGAKFQGCTRICPIGAKCKCKGDFYRKNSTNTCVPLKEC